MRSHDQSNKRLCIMMTNILELHFNLKEGKNSSLSTGSLHVFILHFFQHFIGGRCPTEHFPDPITFDGC